MHSFAVRKAKVCQLHLGSLLGHILPLQSISITESKCSPAFYGRCKLMEAEWPGQLSYLINLIYCMSPNNFPHLYQHTSVDWQGNSGDHPGRESCPPIKNYWLQILLAHCMGNQVFRIFVLQKPWTHEELQLFVCLICGFAAYSPKCDLYSNAVTH